MNYILCLRVTQFLKNLVQIGCKKFFNEVFLTEYVKWISVVSWRG